MCDIFGIWDIVLECDILLFFCGALVPSGLMAVQRPKILDFIKKVRPDAEIHHISPKFTGSSDVKCAL